MCLVAPQMPFVTHLENGLFPTTRARESIYKEEISTRSPDPRSGVDLTLRSIDPQDLGGWDIILLHRIWTSHPQISCFGPLWVTTLEPLFGASVTLCHYALLCIYAIMLHIYNGNHCNPQTPLFTITHYYIIMHNAQDVIIRGQNHPFEGNHSQDLRIWGSEDLRIWDLGIWGSGSQDLGSQDLRIWGSGIWGSEDLGSGDLRIWGSQIPQI